MIGADGASKLVRLRRLFEQALECDPAQRRSFLRERCADEPELEVEVWRMLERDAEATGLLSEQALPVLSGALRQTLAHAMSGKRIGAYEVTGLIGAGGMGRVFQGRRLHDGVEQRVAIKLVRPELASPALQSRFSAERRLLASLDHPGICRFLDSGTTDDGTPYVVMELVEGRPLIEHCDAAGLSVRARVALLRRICSAVEHAHRNLIVHRDLKPGNVLVDAHGQPKLLDFGIAKQLVGLEDSAATATIERFFSPASAAPEQLRGEAVGVACDVYALGVLAYELFCGLPPFDLDGLSAGEIERRLLDIPAPSMTQRMRGADPAIARNRGMSNLPALRKQLAGDLDAIVLTCLRKSPRERYPSVEQLDRELANFESGRPVQARGGNRLYRASKFIRRHALAVGLTTALVLSVAAGIGSMFLQSQALRSERAEALRQRDMAQQIVDLFLQSFSAADPSRVAGADVTIRQVLESARPRLAVLEKSQPDSFATLAAAIAEVELNLGLDEQASELARRALARVPPDGAGLARRLRLIDARALTGVGEMREARDRLQELAGGTGAVPALDWGVAQAAYLVRTSQYEESRALLESLRPVWSPRDAEDEQANEARWLLASSHSGLRDVDASLAALDETIAWQKATLTEDHPRVLISGLIRAEELSRARRHDESIQEAQRVNERIERAYGADSALAGRSSAQLGRSLYRAGRMLEAVQAYEAALQRWERLLGETHPQTVRATFNLALALGYLATDEDRTERTYRQSIERAVRRWGPAENPTSYMRLGYADFLAAAGRWDDALDLLMHAAAADAMALADAGNHKAYLDALARATAGAACADHQAGGKSEPCRRAQALLADPPPPRRLASNDRKP